MKKNKKIDQNLGHKDLATENLIREKIRSLIATSKTDCYASISALLGRSHSYIQQYITRGSPKILKESDRRKIAHYFGIPAQDLMVLDNEIYVSPDQARSQITVKIPVMPTPEAKSAGLRNGDTVPFPNAWLLETFQTPLPDLAFMTIHENNMVPTLCPGDQVLIDRSKPISKPNSGGLYIIRAGDGYIACRISHHPTSGQPIISNDNTVYPPITDCDWPSLEIIGRIIWLSRNLMAK